MTGLVGDLINGDEKAREKLFAHDQLTAEMKKNHVFAGFTEGVYKFPPTFKVKRSAALVCRALSLFLSLSLSLTLSLAESCDIDRPDMVLSVCLRLACS